MLSFLQLVAFQLQPHRLRSQIETAMSLINRKDISAPLNVLPLFTWEHLFELAPHVVGSWRVPALPGNYGTEEWQIIASLLGIQTVAVGGFMFSAQVSEMGRWAMSNLACKRCTTD
jgi:hypothetical protein